MKELLPDPVVRFYRNLMWSGSYFQDEWGPRFAEEKDPPEDLPEDPSGGVREPVKPQPPAPSAAAAFAYLQSQ